MIFIKYRKSDGFILGYGTDVRDDSHPTEATVPMIEGFQFGTHTHYLDGELVSDVEVVKATQRVILRGERNRLLDQVDLVYCNAERWSAMTPAMQQAWREYKQALRDFPETCNPLNPQWPIQPGE